MFSRRSNQGPRFAQVPQGPGMFNQNMFGQNQFQQEPFMQEQMTQTPQMISPNQSTMYPTMQYERLQYEIKENRRRINNLTRRITRLENYLRIRDSSDYSMDEEQVPNEFSM